MEYYEVLGSLGFCFPDTETSEVERPPSSIRPLPGATLRGCTRLTYDTGSTRDRTPSETPVMYRDALCAPPLWATASAPVAAAAAAAAAALGASAAAGRRPSHARVAPGVDVATCQRDICRARLRSVSRDISRHLPKS